MDSLPLMEADLRDGRLPKNAVVTAGQVKGLEPPYDQSRSLSFAPALRLQV